MDALPDDALVIRGGLNLPESFAKGSGVRVDEQRKLDEVSVNSGAGATIEQLTAPNPQTGYPGIPHTKIGVTTVGRIRAAGGDVVRSPKRKNPYHASLSGLTPEEASSLFQPLRPNSGKTVESQE